MALVHDPRPHRAHHPVSSALCVATTLGGLVGLAMLLAWLI